MTQETGRRLWVGMAFGFLVLLGSIGLWREICSTPGKEEPWGASGMPLELPLLSHTHEKRDVWHDMATLLEQIEMCNHRQTVAPMTKDAWIARCSPRELLHL